MFPLKMSLKEKKEKLIEYGTVKKEDDGKIIDDDEDEKPIVALDEGVYFKHAKQ